MKLQINNKLLTNSSFVLKIPQQFYQFCRHWRTVQTSEAARQTTMTRWDLNQKESSSWLIESSAKLFFPVKELPWQLSWLRESVFLDVVRSVSPVMKSLSTKMLDTLWAEADIGEWRPSVCVKKTKSTQPMRNGRWPSSAAKRGINARRKSWANSAPWSTRSWARIDKAVISSTDEMFITSRDKYICFPFLSIFLSFGIATKGLINA